MANKKWKDKGYKGSRYGTATPFLDSGHEHNVEDSETGEERSVQVYSDQTLGEAIDAGNQWTEADNQKDTQNLSDPNEKATEINVESEKLSGKTNQAVKGRKFSDERIVTILREAARQETTIRDVCRSHGISESRFYKWRRRYGGMSTEQVNRMRTLKNENIRLKRELEDRTKEIEALRKSLGGKR